MLYNSGLEIHAANWSSRVNSFSPQNSQYSFILGCHRGQKILGKTCISFCFWSTCLISHSTKLLSFSLSSQLLRTSTNHRSFPKAHAPPVLREARHNLGMEDALLCWAHLIQGGVGSGFQGSKTASYQMWGAETKLGLNVAAVIYIFQDEVHLKHIHIPEQL